MNMASNCDVEFATITGTSLKVSRIGLGTWAIGGWMWGGTDDEQSIATIRAAVERGVNLIDTAPPMDLAAPRRSSAARLPTASCAHAW